MKLANVDGRAVLVVGDGKGIDLERASQGRIGPDPQDVVGRWNIFLDFISRLRYRAEDADVTFTPADLGAPVPRPTQVFAIGVNYREHADESGG